MCVKDPNPEYSLEPENHTINWTLGEEDFPSDLSNYTRELSQRDAWLISFRYNLKHIVLPIVFAIGVIGNILNLVIFCRQRIRRGMNQIERSASAGLVTLAISDLLFCLVGLPAAIPPEYASGSGNEGLVMVAFYYSIYQRALINTFLFCSTWLIVLIALERYLAICWPFQARSLIKVKRTVSIHSIVFLGSILLNVPLFMRYTVIQYPCYNGCLCYSLLPGFYLQNERFALAHRITWSTLGTFIPLLALIFANSFLVRELYLTRSGRLTDEERCSFHRTTITLMAMVFLFLFLVCPSMILEFLQQNVTFVEKNNHAIGIASLITNLTQAIKFSCNFMLYCVMNKQFRQNFQSRCNDGTGSKRSSETEKKYQLVHI